jgi:hypothetical protein
MYATGQGVPQDYTVAASWLFKADSATLSLLLTLILRSFCA